MVKKRRSRPKPTGPTRKGRRSSLIAAVKDPARKREEGPRDGDREPAVTGGPAAERRKPRRFNIVGIGASAGGLEAFSQLLAALPSDSGMAWVLVQHLAPNHQSLLADLLGGSTTLPVVQVVNGMDLQPDHVYVIPPNVFMRVEEGRLLLTPRSDDGGQFMPIDSFFRSLAEDAQGNAIGIVLSGTASDGAIGLREIKAVGGITMAQDSRTAKYDGMPRSAIAMGVVDLVLSPEAMAAELSRIGRHPLVRHLRPHRAGAELALVDDHLHRILSVLRSVTGVDFFHYKQPTIKRRIQRRMVLHRISATDDYIKLLRKDRAEVEGLFQDILINVTRFFREPESFKTLSKEVLPQLLEHRKSEDSLRIWVPGCSTGEEPYSVAMVILEYLGERSQAIQLFGSDISERAIARARAGWFAQSIAADVSAERLQRFFTKSDGGYKINKAVRDPCLFARQDLTRDPPFSKLDLILCRNVLIYLDALLQRKLLTVFHYALKPNGFLMLGGSETTGPNADLFSLVNKRHKVYTRKMVSLRLGIDFALPHPHRDASAPPKAGPEPGSELAIQNEASRLIAARYAPPGVILDNDFQVLQFRGQTGAFLQPAPGDPSLSILKMAREGLLYPLRTALHEARRGEKTVHRQGITVKSNGQTRKLDLEVIPMSAAGSRRHFLVLFLSPPSGQPKEEEASIPAQRPGKKKRTATQPSLRALQEELAASREYLQSIIQDQEAANEELQSANEEILSSNEELQSTNEELDTAREELQSTNEEINTVNEELHGRNDELSRANSDLLNLLGSVQIAIVMVDRDLRIRRLTPVAEKLLNLIPGDVGRPISDLKPAFDGVELEQLITEVMQNISPVEREVRDRNGRWFLLRIRPYKNLDDRIDGAVLSLFDIQESKQYLAKVNQARLLADAIVETAREPLVVLDGELRIRRANKAFSRLFRLPLGELEGRYIYTLGNGEWNVPALKTLLEEVLPKEKSFEDFEVSQDFGAARRRLLLNGRRLEQGDESEPLILLALHDTTRESSR
jgi:two-component system CheB/CheR fusion protein